MKRFHVHVAVENLDDSIRFYSSLFGAEPSVQKNDYAKWMLEDPRLNFAISQRGHARGINHLGFQVDSDAELKGMRGQLDASDAALTEQTGSACCYARSDKHWVTDPSGIAWETFHTLGEVPVFSEDTQPPAQDSTCCVPIKTSSEDQKDAGCCVPSAGTAANSGASACCG